MNHYPRHVGDYIRDTVGLTMLEDGAYTRLLDQYYAREAPLPADKAVLYRMARATSKPERAAVDNVLALFFVLAPDGWHNKRADLELQAQSERSASARQSAKQRWEKEHANAMRTHMQTHSEGNAESMLTSNQKPVSSKTLSSSPETANLDVVSLPAQEGKPSRLRQEAVEVVTFLNGKTDRHYRMTDTTLRPVMARLKEGYSLRECRAVIARKCREWGSDDQMVRYLRPATLFGAEKFAQYVGEVPAETEVSDGASLS